MFIGDIRRQEKQQKTKQHSTMNLNEVNTTREEYDFTNARKNPYVKKVKKQITINIDSEAIDYFKEQSAVSGIPYQTLINLYLADCASKHRKINVSWE